MGWNPSWPGLGSQGREKLSLTLLVSLAGSEKQPDRLTGKKKHTCLFHVNYMWHGSLCKEIKTQRDSWTCVLSC